MDTGTIILILGFAIPVLIILLILFFMRRGFRKQMKFAKDLNEKISRARPSTAVVIASRQGMVGGDINRIIHLKLRVNDTFGGPYEAEATWFVDTLHFDKIKEGNNISVKIDADEKSVIYPDESWGKYTSGYENL